MRTESKPPSPHNDRPTSPLDRLVMVNRINNAISSLQNFESILQLIFEQVQRARPTDAHPASDQPVSRSNESSKCMAEKFGWNRKKAKAQHFILHFQKAPKT